VAPMDAMGIVCPDCGAEFAPGARFCPRCGSFAGITGPVPGGQPTAAQPQWPGQGRTVTVTPTPGRPVRAPRAALPAAPVRAEPPADATRADWSDPTVTRQPGYPQSPQPFPQPFPQPPQAFQQPPQAFQQPPQAFQQPSPPTRAEPARYQAPLPQDGPPGYPQDGYASAGYPQDRRTQDRRPQDGYAPAGYQQGGFAPAGYPQDGYAPTEYAPGGDLAAGYPPRSDGGLGPFDPVPPSQGPQSPDGPQRAPRQPPRRHDRGSSGVPLAVWIVLLVLLVGGAAAALKIAHPFSHTGTGSGTAARTGASGSASGSPTTSHGGTASPGTASGTATAATERQAAAGVAALLSQSAADRTATSAAASDIASCGPKLRSDAAVFASAVTSRQALLSKLAALPGRAALPPALVTDLTKAWQASITADQAYTKWANDELAKTCVPQDTADPGFQATVAPNQQATTDKTQFAAAWNPVAAQYGLTRYQPGQL
jgi:hypothetical protein